MAFLSRRGLTHPYQPIGFGFGGIRSRPNKLSLTIIANFHPSPIFRTICPGKIPSVRQRKRPDRKDPGSTAYTRKIERTISPSGTNTLSESKAPDRRNQLTSKSGLFPMPTYSAILRLRMVLLKLSLLLCYTAGKPTSYKTR